MKHLAKLVMAEKPQDRLEFALMLLDELTGEDSLAMALIERYGLTRTEARLVAALNVRAPAETTHQALFAALCGHGERHESGSRLVYVHLVSIRRKLPVQIVSVWGFGYRLVSKIKLADILVDKLGRAA